MADPMTPAPMTDADLEALRTMPFTTSLDVGCGKFATDEERHLYWLAVHHYNAKLRVIDELKRVRAELADTRRVVAEWVWNSNCGRGTDPGDLQYAFERDGRRPLAPEFDAIEAEEAHDA